ncbi:probable L-type lectin-domain containing receptor kinase S.7 [Beta vulgaris subsp. vulgaris]|uniref:probable L-type lectin-domain containing receptor kinase S.7 n=1 Tax=Beta vulgaris subsp. vulgaris TaxID=3555 RepID=UPI0020371B33|nr:probable L-type lectin-domain containing receptor kinase S.7 [Beta vulgaris subsp. vulgaris]
MISSPINLLFVIITLIFFLLTIPTSASSVSFHFLSFNPRNFTLLGDSYLKNGVVGLTREVTVPTTSSGSIIYNNPIPFYDSETNITASFSAKFSFSVSNVNPTSSSGDGLAFFLSPDNQTLGSPGGYLGLVNSTELTKNRFIAIEFDTKLDPFLNDPNDNHVGFDVNSLISIKTTNVVSKGIDLKSGDLINVWVDYKNEEKLVEIYMGYSSTRPLNPVLEVEIDLSEYLKEYMYVGFSGSTEGSTEVHLIESFDFQTFGFLPRRPKFRTHNVSDSSVIIAPAPSLGSSSKNLRKRIGLGLVISGPVFCCVVLVVFGFFSIKKWKTIKKQKSLKAEMVTGPKEFSYRELKLATRGFHSSRILGNGAFGTVYKAYFTTSGNVAAVKRSKHTHEGKTEFLAELSIIACLRHKNLLQLQGWCVEKGELLLVYDFMSNGSLDKVLYPEIIIDTNPLPWPQRYNIAVGLASVLTYLHQECEQQVIHRDIKASNVMLDGNFNPKLGDFGLARLMEHDKSPVSTLTAGTMGYLAPEYLQYGKATEKTDVFSYGVVALEVACGRQPIERENDDQKMINLVDWVWGLHSEGRLIEAADPRLQGEFDQEEMKKLLLVGLSCANPDCLERPNMRRVLQILNNEADPMLVPKSKPTLIFSSSLPLSLADIFSDDEEDSKSSEDRFQITVQSSQDLKEIC